MKTKIGYFVVGLIFFAALVMTGCAPRGYSSDPYYGDPGYGSAGYDPAYDAPSGSYSADEADCRRIADNASGSTVVEAGKGAVIGGALGAAAGAAGGAIAGDAGKGAAIGAATGGIGGAAVQGVRTHDDYDQIYADCMRRRGHSVY